MKVAPFLVIIFAGITLCCVNKYPDNKIDTENLESTGQDANAAHQLFQEAEAQRENGNEDEAKSLYEKAAGMGSPDAHYALTDYFIVDDVSEMHHLKEAELLGHQEALDSLIGYMIGEDDPAEILEIINPARSPFPNLTVRDEVYRMISRAAEAGRLDLPDFLASHHIAAPSGGGYEPYFTWELAEDASRSGGIIPGPDMRLTLQLVARGGHALAEMESAIDFAYEAWKSGTDREFNIANHITSGFGGNWVTAREQENIDAVFSEQYNAVLQKIPSQNQELFAGLHEASEAFLDAKIWNEEGHDGTGYYTWAMNSLNAQRREFFETIEGLMEGSITVPSQDDNEKELNEFYQQLIAFVRDNHVGWGRSMLEEEDVRKTQRLWLPYRDQFIAFLQVIHPEVSGDSVRIWLNEKRIENFIEMLGRYVEDEY